MTTIITYRTDKKVYMLGDTNAEVQGIINIKTTKVFKEHGWLIGVAGSLDIAYEIFDKFKHIYTPKEIPHVPSWFAEQSRKLKYEDDNATLILCNKKQSYKITDNGYYPIEEEFYSIGNGSPIAYGAYESWKAFSAITADPTIGINILKCIMDVCIKRSPGTGGEITILELDI